ncbi:uncharacterized protein L969DRAFT_94614 [Mixia osmundae IAM 14324]|uniref:Protein AF-9 homolog n=1 Tax=Mixia osmundae (strain CBS 9802 / IAM 14324 / JCM 22182 / KY 12970) TaxID=764103 RepID=G7DVJ0_MIXOS|nr:uncharacterized protein L969DRAFT_94614 [Mixia osmundae IAM 14324]KEI39559.1 hypothetical protein L969DRAFT_94614 [Mixia osmundae IAM 14324]GAA94600.1 hypothetical protein E5Q_01252 [Mixia osmundae IAM 14324]
MSNKRIKGISIHRPVIYGNTAVLLKPGEPAPTGHTHRWTVGLRSAASPLPASTSSSRGQGPSSGQAIGGCDDLSYFIKKVTFKLHDTYANPTRSIDRPPFEVTETGWGQFEVLIKVYFVPESSEKPLSLYHEIRLHPWTAVPSLTADEATPNASTYWRDGLALVKLPGDSGKEAVLSPIHSWQYDEIVFQDPTEALYNIMTETAPTPLPKTSRLPPSMEQGLPLGVGGNIGELTLDTEAKEAAKLEEARKTVLTDLEELRATLIEQEKELADLRREHQSLPARRRRSAGLLESCASASSSSYAHSAGSATRPASAPDDSQTGVRDGVTLATKSELCSCRQ